MNSAVMPTVSRAVLGMTFVACAIALPMLAVRNPIWVGAAVALAALSLAALLNRTVVPPVALATAVGLVMLGGAPSAPGSVQLGALIGASGLLVVALLVSTRGGGASQTRVAILICSWFGLLVFVGLIGGRTPLDTMLMAVAPAVLAAAVATRLDDHGRRLALRLFVVLVLGQVVLGIAELTVLSQPLWGYMQNSAGIPVIRANPLIPGLDRVQGSLGHPLIFGFLTAVGFMIVWHARTISIYRRSALLAVLGAGVALSGTRSALLAVVVAVSFSIVSSSRTHGWGRVVLYGLSVAIASYALWDSVEQAAGELGGSGSYTHRAGALDALPGLIQRSGLEAFFGSGFGSTRSLFDRGLLQAGQFYAIDNQWVTTLALTGLVGLGVMLTAVIASFVLSTTAGRAVTIAVGVMFFSFDLSGWVLTSMVLAAGLVLGVRPRTATPNVPAIPQPLAVATR